jgi:hypothetical protein
VVVIAFVGEIPTFVFFFGVIVVQGFECFCCRMAHPWKKFKCQRKVTNNNQQVNVVANEEEVEVEQRIIIYTLTFEGKP